MSNFNFLGNFLGKKAKLVKDGHDLSNREAFSIPFGVHVPVKHYFCVPNEHYKGSIHGVCQTSPMREDNFAQLDMHQKAVFVPMSSLCRNYLELTKASKSARKDALLDFPIYDLRFDLMSYLKLMFPFYFYHQWLSELASEFELADLSVKWNSSSNFPYFVYKGADIVVNNASSNALKCFYAMIVEGYNRRGFVLNGSATIKASTLLSRIGSWTSRANTAFVFDFLRLLDQLEYGNYIPYYDKLTQNVINKINLDPTNRGVIPFVLRNVSSYSSESFQIYDYLLPDFFYDEWTTVTPNDLHITSESLWPILAYQFYINTYERTNYRNPDSFVLTGDVIFNDHNTMDVLELPFVDNALFLISRLDFHDLNFIFDAISDAFYPTSINDFANFSQPFTLFGYLFTLSNPLLPADVFTTSQLSIVEGSRPHTTIEAVTHDMVHTMAETSALYKLKQDLLRGGVRRDKQMLSIFGVSGNQHLYEPCQILADSDSPIQIQGLLNQAATEVAPLGARGARGNGGVGCRFDFNTEDYGFLFIIQYVTTPVFYEAMGIQLNHQYGINQWWIPQFNHLGLSPVYRSFLSLFTGSNASDLGSYADDLATVGFSARDYDLKQQVNKLHGLFTNYGMSVNTFNSSAQDSLYNKTALLRGNAAFGGFIPSIINQQNSGFRSKTSLTYYPGMVNNLFVNMVAAALFNDFSSDPFRCFNVYEISKVSPMPKLGLYKLDV